MTETRGMTAPTPWWHRHANVSLLARWMADNGHSADEVARAVEKPWNYEDLFTKARAAFAAEEAADG